MGSWSRGAAAFAAVLSCVAGLAWGPGAAAAVIDAYPGEHNTTAIHLDGEIIPGDANRLAYVVHEARLAGRRVDVLRLDSKGGDLIEGLRLADVVSSLGLTTVIPGRDICASACFFPFAAGVRRMASPDGRVGVHGVSEGALGETGPAKSMTVDVARRLNAYHVPAEVIGEMVVTPPDRMRWLSAAELRQMGVAKTP